ncbi:pyridoxal phosphate homeostasis protein [Euwallacea similis]|uniref:pyridoxal phosphate homeostasis protein n=1 Tax=Euwallacea similis TaxID=1736056 RepID=UPI00344D6F88
MIRSMAEVNVKKGLKTALQRIEDACSKRSMEFRDLKPRLVAVSKVKPAELIVEVYEAGQRHFGENYVQELQEKSMHPLILEKCPDIKWHFIGHLQTNKINKVLSIPNLYIIETVHSRKLASQLNNNWPNFGPADSKLKIMVQVNTSGEKEKSGVNPSDVTEITNYVLKECHNLRFEGLMTIGEYGYDYSKGPNPDFLSLIKCRDEVCKRLGLDWKEVELSMGMSNDFDKAIEMGSTNVRVGQLIFGERQYKN